MPHLQQTSLAAAAAYDERVPADSVKGVAALGREKQPIDLGAATGKNTSELSRAFGVQPAGKRMSWFDDGPMRENVRGLFVGSNRVCGINNHICYSEERVGGDTGSGTGSSDGEGSSVSIFEDSKQRRMEGGATRSALNNVERSWLDTLDRLMGLHETLDDDFSQSITTGSMDFSRERTGDGNDSTQNRTKNNELYISESSDDASGDGRPGHKDEEECRIVFNPIIVGNVSSPAVSREKRPGDRFDLSWTRSHSL